MQFIVSLVQFLNYLIILVYGPIFGVFFFITFEFKNFNCKILIICIM